MNKIPQKILIIRMSSLGDVLLVSPLLRLLRKRFPEAQIDFLVRPEYAELVRYNPYLNRVMAFDTRHGLSGLYRLRQAIRRERYDVILDIHRNLRSIILRLGMRFNPLNQTRVFVVKKNQIMRYFLVKFKINLYEGLSGGVIPVWEKYVRAAASLGIRPDGQGPELFLSPEAEEVAGNFYRDLPGGDWKVVMAPGARHYTKRWPAEYYAQLIGYFYRKYGIKTILVGGPEDVVTATKIQGVVPHDLAVSVVGRFSVLETAAVMKKAKLVISNDSGLMHVAAAMGKPLVAIFGSTVKELGFFPTGEKVIMVENEGLYCRPCSHIGRCSCPEQHFRCMLEIKPEMLWSRLESEFGTMRNKSHR